MASSFALEGKGGLSVHAGRVDDDRADLSADLHRDGDVMGWGKTIGGLAVGGGLIFLLVKKASARAGGQAPGPKPMLESKPRPKRKTGERVNVSRLDAAGSVFQSPKALLKQAREFDADVSLDELAGARLIASEYARGTDMEWATILDAELNRANAKGQSLMWSLTGKSGRFGRQGASPSRPASTARDPRMAHLEMAIGVIRKGHLRGIARGATRFFDPRVQDAMHRKWTTGKTKRIHSCSASDLLEAWAFDYRRGLDSDGKRRRRCPADKSREGKNTLAWVGPIDGVDAYELMLMAPMPTGTKHTTRYVAARALIEAKRRTTA